MQNLGNRNVVLLSKNIDVREKIRLIMRKFPEFNLQILKSKECLLSIIDPKLIIIDLENLKDLPEILETLKILRKSYSFYSLFLVYDIEKIDILEIFKYGIDDIIENPIKISLIDALFHRYFRNFKDTVDTVLHYRGIDLYLEDSYAIFRECKIPLNRVEGRILSILMESHKPISIDGIRSKVSYSLNKEISNQNIRINIYRIRQKFIKCTGLNIIGNEYERGYYISV